MLDNEYMFGLSHELIYTWANNPDGTINRERLVKVVQEQFIAVQKSGYKEGREDAARELQEGINVLIDEFE